MVLSDKFRFVKNIESTGASKAGIVKIKAPPGWEPNKKPADERYNKSRTGCRQVGTNVGIATK